LSCEVTTTQLVGATTILGYAMDPSLNYQRPTLSRGHEASERQEASREQEFRFYKRNNSRSRLLRTESRLYPAPYSPQRAASILSESNQVEVDENGEAGIAEWTGKSPHVPSRPRTVPANLAALGGALEACRPTTVDGGLGVCGLDGRSPNAKRRMTWVTQGMSELERMGAVLGVSGDTVRGYSIGTGKKDSTVSSLIGPCPTPIESMEIQDQDQDGAHLSHSEEGASHMDTDYDQMAPPPPLEPPPPEPATLLSEGDWNDRRQSAPPGAWVDGGGAVSPGLPSIPQLTIETKPSERHPEQDDEKPFRYPIVMKL